MTNVPAVERPAAWLCTQTGLTPVLIFAFRALVVSVLLDIAFLAC